MDRRIVRNRKYVPLPNVRSKPVPGTSSSRNRRPVGDVRVTDPRLSWKRQQSGPATRTIAKRRTT
jgi:hypothetical protein